jgi:hypothetical protein
LKRSHAKAESRAGLKEGGLPRKQRPLFLRLPFRLAVLVTAGSLLALLAAACSGGEAPADGRTIRIDIPSNATRLVDEGRPVPGVPGVIRGRVGDTLVVSNADRSTQFLVGYPVAPGQTLRIPLNRAGDYETECTAHKDGAIRMRIDP